MPTRVRRTDQLTILRAYSGNGVVRRFVKVAHYLNSEFVLGSA